MDYCSARKYLEYARSTHSMTSRVGVDAVLSGGPPNRMAPNVTVVPGHRHQQVLRYHEHQQRLAALHSSEGLYQHHHHPHHHPSHQQHPQQHQHHAFDRYLPSVGYSADYHQPNFGAGGLSYGSLGRRHIPSAYLNAPHTPLPHHLYHPQHYDSTYNGRLIGGGIESSYHSYREGYDQQQNTSLHYPATERASAFQYANSAAPAPHHQREYLQHYYPYHHHPSNSFIPLEERRYGQHNLHSINGLQVQSPKDSNQDHDDDRRTTKKNPDAQHITDSYAQQQQQQQVSSMGITMIASPLTSGSTSTDSGISGSSRCGSTPISMVATSAGLSSDFTVNNSISEENCNTSEEYNKDDQEISISERNDAIDSDQQFSPNSSSIIPSSSPKKESERTLSEKQCASNRRSDCPTPLHATPERCGTPFVTNSHHHSSSFQHHYQFPHKKDSTEVLPSHNPKPLSPEDFSPSSNKRIFKHDTKLFDEKKNRIVECDLIPNKKSKRKPNEGENVREEIRNIKPLPGFQQAFGSTEIGRFFEAFRNIPTNSYSYESEFDVNCPQPWEADSLVDGSPYDVQISASLQTLYKSPLVDKKYLNGIRCNGY